MNQAPPDVLYGYQPARNRRDKGRNLHWCYRASELQRKEVRGYIDEALKFSRLTATHRQEAGYAGTKTPSV
jgi:hypothetical protein